MTYPTQTSVDKVKPLSFGLKTTLSCFCASRRPHSSRRDKNRVPLAQFKTHLSRWVFVFISSRTTMIALWASYDWLCQVMMLAKARSYERLRRVLA